jgi:cytochrome c-type biogenesis protein CcmE
VSLDVSPRTSEADERTRSAGRRWMVGVVIAVLLVGGFVAIRALSSASVFFYTVDEAVQRQPELGTKRFRLEGLVVPDSVTETAEGVEFRVSNGAAVVTVDHVGDPPQLFQPCIPVVLEGAFTSPDGADRFASDLILVKHTEEYSAANPDRLDEAEGTDCSVGAEGG